MRVSYDFYSICKIFLVILLFVCSSYFSSAVVITPSQITISNYDAAQETIITAYNDQFEPIGFQPTLMYESSYLQEYVSIDPETFLLEHDEQHNIRVLSSFPSNFPPQEHKIVFETYPNSGETFTLSFRPAGIQQVSLLAQEMKKTINDFGESFSVQVMLKNAGNTVLFVKPQIIIKKNDSSIVKNITYQQPIIILPSDEYPLVLRQDNGDLIPGNYVAVVQAMYKADKELFISNNHSFNFTVEERISSFSNDEWWKIPGIIVFVLIIAGCIVFFVPKIVRMQKQHRERRMLKKKQKDLINTSRFVNEKLEIDALRKRLKKLSENTRLLVEEAQKVLEEKKGGLK